MLQSMVLQRVGRYLATKRQTIGLIGKDQSQEGIFC